MIRRGSEGRPENYCRIVWFEPPGFRALVGPWLVPGGPKGQPRPSDQKRAYTLEDAKAVLDNPKYRAQFDPSRHMVEMYVDACLQAVQARVIARGLKGAERLNGKRGIVEKHGPYEQPGERWEVKFEGEKDAVKIKPINLHLGWCKNIGDVNAVNADQCGEFTHASSGRIRSQ